MNAPGNSPPQRVLTPRRKRAFLSFRRKSDLLWFLTSVVMFSGGAAAFVFAIYSIKQKPEPVSMSVEASPPSPAPAMTLPLPPPAPPSPTVKGEGLRKDNSTPRLKTDERRPAPLTPKLSVRSNTAIPIHVPVSPPKIEVKAPMPVPSVRAVPSGATVSRAPQKREFIPLQSGIVFKTDGDNAAKASLEVVRFQEEPALELTYDLRGGDWVRCFVNVRENFSNFSRVQFLFKGEGSNNTLEFRLVDLDGTTAGALWSQQTGKKAWTVVDLPLIDLSYFWGGDPIIDKGRIRQIIFVVSKRAGDAGGRGRVTIRGIKFS